jgi:hypothetical protein
MAEPWDDTTRRVKKMIDRDLWKKARAQAKENGQRMPEFLEQCIKNELARVGNLHKD